MRSIRRTLALLPLAALAACGESPVQAGVFRLDGTWQGRAFPYELALTFQHDRENQVTGTGELRGLVVRTSGTLADTVIATRADVTVEGRWAYPDFVLQLQGEGYHPVRMEAHQARRDSMNVVLRGSGFERVQIRMARQTRAD
jgi:hypothetical protein